MGRIGGDIAGDLSHDVHQDQDPQSVRISHGLLQISVNTKGTKENFKQQLSAKTNRQKILKKYLF